jgi:hypothetical protein
MAPLVDLEGLGYVLGDGDERVGAGVAGAVGEGGEQGGPGGAFGDAVAREVAGGLEDHERAAGGGVEVGVGEAGGMGDVRDERSAWGVEGVAGGKHARLGATAGIGVMRRVERVGEVAKAGKGLLQRERPRTDDVQVDSAGGAEWAVAGGVGAGQDGERVGGAGLERGGGCEHLVGAVRRPGAGHAGGEFGGRRSRVGDTRQADPQRSGAVGDDTFRKLGDLCTR